MSDSIVAAPPSGEAVQDHYPDHLAWCYGCGRLNEHGHHVRTFWDGDETVAIFQPQPYHMAIPGYVYGGLLASLIDCHGTGTAAAAAERARGQSSAETEPPRFLTASLHVDYLKPTPLGPALELRGRVQEMSGRKVIVSITLAAATQICVRGEVVAVQVPDHYVQTLIAGQ